MVGQRAEESRPLMPVPRSALKATSNASRFMDRPRLWAVAQASIYPSIPTKPVAVGQQYPGFDRLTASIAIGARGHSRVAVR